MGQITSKKTSKKAQKDIAAQGFENIDMPGNIHALMEEEDQTFMQNGIIVENKYDLTDAEKIKKQQEWIAKRFSGQF